MEGPARGRGRLGSSLRTDSLYDEGRLQESLPGPTASAHDGDVFLSDSGECRGSGENVQRACEKTWEDCAGRDGGRKFHLLCHCSHTCHREHGLWLRAQEANERDGDAAARVLPLGSAGCGSNLGAENGGGIIALWGESGQ